MKAKGSCRSGKCLQSKREYVTVSHDFAGAAASEGENGMAETPEERLAERVRPLVNDILARFNQEGVTPQEAGMVVLALTHRLLMVLDANPEEQRGLILQIINLINNYLAGELQEE
jgi:hypothetical protein